MKKLKDMSSCSGKSLKSVATPDLISNKMKEFLKNGVDVKENLLTYPEIRDANELRAIIRSIYWLNNKSTLSKIKGLDASEANTGDDVKEQISLAFDALKSCNELSASLDRRRKKRETSILAREAQLAESESHQFPHVKYQVGQAVKHKRKSWRGVIVGWDIIERNKVSSLTTKQYTISHHIESGEKDRDSSSTNSKVVGKDDGSSLKYTVIVDMNDAKADTIELESQVDLIPVDDSW